MVAHHYDVTQLAPLREKGEPEQYPRPRVLSLYFSLGDHLLVAGGVWDQPVGDWLALQRAGYIWRTLEEERQATPEYPIEKRLDEADLVYLFETLRPIRVRLMQHE